MGTIVGMTLGEGEYWPYRLFITWQATVGAMLVGLATRECRELTEPLNAAGT